MGFSARVLEVFKINNITMKDILEHKYTLSDFGKLPNLGRTSMKQIKEIFFTHGFTFKDNDKHFKEIDHYYAAKKANEEVIDKCRKALVTSFNNIVQKNSFSHQEFNTAMNEHKKILNMFEQNVRNVL